MITNNSNLISKNYNLNLKTDLKARTYQFSIDVIKLAEAFPQKRVYWIVADQLLRAAMSIGANIIEAKASSSKKDFINYFHISLKSANETLYWLSLLKDSDLVDSDKIDSLTDELNQICRMLGSSLLTMKGKR